MAARRETRYISGVSDMASPSWPAGDRADDRSPSAQYDAAYGKMQQQLRDVEQQIESLSASKPRSTVCASSSMTLHVTWCTNMSEEVELKCIV